LAFIASATAIAFAFEQDLSDFTNGLMTLYGLFPIGERADFQTENIPTIETEKMGVLALVGAFRFRLCRLVSPGMVSQFKTMEQAALDQVVQCAKNSGGVWAGLANS
jgi:hypothetical protein